MNRMLVLAPLTVIGMGILIVSGVNTGASIASANGSSARPARETNAVAEVVAMLRRVGITPETLAAAGVSPQQADAILVLARAQMPLEVRRDVLRYDTEVAAAKRTGTTAVGAQVARDSILESVYASVSGLLSPDQQAALQHLKANRHWEVPTEYKVLQLSQAQWIALRQAIPGSVPQPDVAPDALSPEPAAATATTAPSALQELGLETPAVQAARSGLANRAEIESRWRAAMTH